MSDDDRFRLPDHVLEEVQRLAAEAQEPEGRAEVLVEDRGRTERVLDGSTGVVTVTLTNRSVTEHAGGDVRCDLRPDEARRLAAALLDLADELDPPPSA